MKRLFACTLLALTSAAFGATLNPVQLLNPAGSTAGQAIISTGSATPPAWGNVSISALTGVLPVAHGGTNASSASGIALDNITGFSGTGFLTRTGTGTYAFQSATNGITYGNLAQAGANTLLGNSTSSTANVSAITVTGCNGAAQALQWTNGSGFGCNSSIATSGANSNITSLTGLTTPLSVAQGGTGTTTSTGTGSVVLSASPTFTGTVNAAAITVSGLITPATTAGIKGTTAGDNANSGSIGEFPTPTNLSGVSLASNTSTNVASVVLTAGDWDVSGTVIFNPTGASTQQFITSISTTTSTIGGGFNNGRVNFGSALSGAAVSLPTPVVRINVTTTTTVYLVAQVILSAGTMTGDGFIRARRVR